MMNNKTQSFELQCQAAIASEKSRIGYAEIRPDIELQMKLNSKAQILGLGLEAQGEGHPPRLYIYALLPFDEKEEDKITRVFALVERSAPIPEGAIVYDMFNVTGSLAGQVKQNFLVELPHSQVDENQSIIEQQATEEERND